MDIVCVGLNHKTAPIRLRECLAFSVEEARAAMESLSRNPVLDEVLILSTCNRVEVLAASEDPEAAVAGIREFLYKEKNVPPQELDPALYAHAGPEAVRHVFRVACSLDSMVLGEPQILGQIKESYRSATACKATGVVLNRLLHRAFATAKRVRKETGIGGKAVSISYAAVELAKKIFGDLEEKSVLLIGAGEMAELTVEHLVTQKAAPVFVANRTFSRAADLAARFGGTAIRFEEIQEHLKIVDIIISQTGAPETVIRLEHLDGVMRKRRNRPLFFIDIAVPRDIDPAINSVGNAYVYDIDDLEGVVEENREQRKSEAVRAERIVEEAMLAFGKWFESLDVVPTIVALREKMEALRQAEMKKTFSTRKNLSPEDREAIDRLTLSITDKALQGPILFLKSERHSKARKRDHLNTAREMFDLNE